MTASGMGTGMLWTACSTGAGDGVKGGMTASGMGTGMRGTGMGTGGPFVTGTITGGASSSNGPNSGISVRQGGGWTCTLLPP